MDDVGSVLCACGCGERLAPVDGRGRPHRFVFGHQSRHQPHQRVLLVCEQCSAPFSRPQWHLHRVKHHFCSQTCAGRWASEHGTKRGASNGHYRTITVACAGCAVPVSKARSLIKRRNNRVYCPECIPKVVRRGRTGYYVGYPHEFSASLRAAVRKRDGYACRLCGRHQREAGTLHVHHIDYDKGHNELMNLIALCKTCHGRTNWALATWTATFQAMMQNA